ncbi:hypothetical protein PR048_026116 [Dryococelus australis]|uniref:Uncharacterized protein n=1 Tax=Dryococelus australis TaxID=614101 RepID=A0ABQ9GKE6_9NEOP|nr:hypothetical protein PR048_026116 [Dryococelus australis]
MALNEALLCSVLKVAVCKGRCAELRCRSTSPSEVCSRVSLRGTTLLTVHLGETGSIPGRVVSIPPRVGIVSDDAAGRRVFTMEVLVYGVEAETRKLLPLHHLLPPWSSRVSPVSLALAFRRFAILTSPTSALKTSIHPKPLNSTPLRGKSSCHEHMAGTDEGTANTVRTRKTTQTNTVTAIYVYRNDITRTQINTMTVTREYTDGRLRTRQTNTWLEQMKAQPTQRGQERKIEWLEQMPVNLLASHQGEPGSVPGWITPGFLHAGIVPDDAAARPVFSGIPRFPTPSFRRCSILTSITLIGSQDLAGLVILEHDMKLDSRMERRWNERAGGSGSTPRKPAGKRHRPANPPGIEPGSPWWEASSVDQYT